MSSAKCLPFCSGLNELRKTIRQLHPSITKRSLNSPAGGYSCMQLTDETTRPQSRDWVASVSIIPSMYTAQQMALAALVAAFHSIYNTLPWQHTGPLNRACHLGGHFWDYYPHALSLSQITATHLKVRSSNESHWLDILTGYQDSNPNNGHQRKCPILTVEKLFCKIPKYAISAKIFLCHHCSISANGSQKCRTLLIFSSPVFSWGHVYLFCTSISVILGILMAELCWLPGPRLNIKTIFPSMGISMLKIRWSQDCLIFNMGIRTLVRRHLNNEMDPWLWLNIGHSGPRSSQCQAKCCCCLGWLDSMLDIYPVSHHRKTGPIST